MPSADDGPIPGGGPAIDEAQAPTLRVADDDLDWRRPHPFTIVMEIGNALRQMAFALVAVGGGFLNVGSLFEMTVIVAPLGAAIGRWYTTRYALGPESVHHRYGLLRRRKQVLPRANVQNVSTKAGLVARIGSVVELHISDASSTGDVKLRLVSREEADRLTTVLRSDRVAAMASVTPVDESPVFGPPRPGHDAVEPAPATSGSLDADRPEPAVGSATDGPFGTPVDRAADIEPPLGRLFLADLTSIDGLANMAIAVVVACVIGLIRWVVDIDIVANRLPLPAVLGVIVLPVFLLVVSLVQRLTVFGGYRLFAEPDRLRIESGLLTEARIAARRERIQLLEVRRDLTHQRLGIERIRFETADIETQGTAATTYLSPVAATDDWKEVARMAIGGTELTEDDLQPVSRLTIRRTIIRSLIPIVIVATVAAVPSWPAGLAILAVGVALAALYARRRHRVLGFAVDDEHALVRTGVVAGRLWLLRLDKIQAIRSQAGLFQRRLGLADVGLSTAGTGGTGLIVIPDLPAEQAEALVRAFAHRSARTPLGATL
ncbi:MAG: PH domain-containing protein [Actinomycetota bacterium]